MQNHPFSKQTVVERHHGFVLRDEDGDQSYIDYWLVTPPHANHMRSTPYRSIPTDHDSTMTYDALFARLTALLEPIGDCVAHDFQKDIDTVQRIAAVPTILDVACRATGMGFAAVARVTTERWVACQVLDNIHFGLPPGGELKVETTLCHEVRQHHEIIAIDNVAEDVKYCKHHTPQM